MTRDLFYFYLACNFYSKLMKKEQFVESFHNASVAVSARHMTIRVVQMVSLILVGLCGSCFGFHLFIIPERATPNFDQCFC